MFGLHTILLVPLPLGGVRGGSYCAGRGKGYFKVGHYLARLRVGNWRVILRDGRILLILDVTSRCSAYKG